MPFATFSQLLVQTHTFFLYNIYSTHWNENFMMAGYKFYFLMSVNCNFAVLLCSARNSRWYLHVHHQTGIEFHFKIQMSFQNQKKATVSSTIIRRCYLKCYPVGTRQVDRKGTGVLSVSSFCVWYIVNVHVCISCNYAFFVFYFVGLRSIAVGLSVYCSDSGSGCEQTKELQKKMKS